MMTTEATKLLTTEVCPVCGAPNAEIYVEGDDTLSLESVGSSRTKLSPGRVLRCRKCRMGFRSFRPSAEQLAALYRDADNSLYESEAPNRLKTAHRHRRLVERYIGTGSLIDVGSASGTFLHIMAESGWRVYGVEPSPSLCERASKILGSRGTITCGTLENATFPHPVNLITLFDVLEHVTDPIAVLSSCTSLLLPGGYLIINVPRIDSPMARVLKTRWPLLLAEHLNYFTVDSLCICAEKAGLDLISTGSRPVSFSIDYILCRLSQHRIFGAEAAQKIARNLGVKSFSIPIWMGEIFAVFKKR